MRQTHSAGLPKRQITPEAMLRGLSGRLHFHPCRACSLRYGCSCATPERNACCQACREVRPNVRPLWDRSNDPSDCCYGNCEQVTSTADLAAHKLAGPGPWFRCRTCKRTHGRLPRRGT